MCLLRELFCLCGFFVVVVVFYTCLSVSVVASHEVYLSPKIHIYFAILRAYAHTHMHVRLYTCSDQKAAAGVGSLYHVVPWDQTQVFSFGGMHFYTLSTFTDP